MSLTRLRQLAFGSALVAREPGGSTRGKTVSTPHAVLLSSEGERSKTGEGQDESCPSILLGYRERWSQTGERLARLTTVETPERGRRGLGGDRIQSRCYAGLAPLLSQ